MNIDFHFGATYVIARAAGFDHLLAHRIACASEYVDDAVTEGVIRFAGGPMYEHMSSAHKMLDYRNFEELANHHAWIPFHFLPGNNGKSAETANAASFEEKLVTTPDSWVARDMVRACIADRHQPYALHRLGITMHVYADTWAHQGFSGIAAPQNRISHISDPGLPDSQHMMAKLANYFGDIFDRGSSSFIGDVLPLGHGAALSYPDQPYLVWTYTDDQGQTTTRHNPDVFMEAAEQMCKAMQHYRAGDTEAPVEGLPSAIGDKLHQLFTTVTQPDPLKRHRLWLDAIAAGAFGFAGEPLTYAETGPGSWLDQALKVSDGSFSAETRFDFEAPFLSSDWKLFHDALLAHRFSVINTILPRYGICVA